MATVLRDYMRNGERHLEFDHLPDDHRKREKEIRSTYYKLGIEDDCGYELDSGKAIFEPKALGVDPIVQQGRHPAVRVITK